MTSHEGAARDQRPAEAASGTDGEHLYGCSTPLPEKYEAGEWEPYTMRKPHSGLQSAYGVLRTDRTPLNTPYTPAVVKLQLRRQEESQRRDDERPQPARALVATLRAGISHLVQPLHFIHSHIDRLLIRVLPRAISQTTIFANHRGWVVWYLTTALSIPFVMLLSPMVIAFCICTSPIWITAMVVLLIREAMPSSKHTTDVMQEEYVHSPQSQHRVNGSRVNGVTSAADHDHHSDAPPSMQRRATHLVENEG